MYRLVCVLALIFGITTIIVSVHVVEGRWVSMTLGVLFAVCGFAMLLSPQTVVKSDTQIVLRQFRLFGRLLVWSREYRFSDFAAVAVRRTRGSYFGRDPDQFFVYLRRHSGRQILVRYFEADIARRCRPAEELAQKLSKDLQIEIDNKDV